MLRLDYGSDPLMGWQEMNERTVYKVLGAISFTHFLNDTMQSLLVASYPLFKSGFHLSFAQIGLITLSFQFTASLLQPAVGLYTDRHPKPFSLAIGMGSTLIGLLTLSMATSFPMLLLAAALVGTGSSVFHPEASRVARMASAWFPEASWAMPRFIHPSTSSGLRLTTSR